jgi:myo-inositol 2-dehydrogenase/D-chiro-inositol 1-dehydrogenase
MTVRIVVLGVGRIGSMHADYLHRRIAGAEVVGVFDVHAETAQAVGAELGVPVAATLEDALAIEADAVAICTSTDTHVDCMVAAAQAGRAIFCEKPVSLDLAEVDRGLAAVASAGVAMQIGFNRRFDPSHKAVADAVRSGFLGDVHVVKITSRDPAPPPISYIEVSGGLFNDMTIHDFDMARYVTGSEVESVYAVGAVRVDPAIGTAGDIDTAVVVLTHENGAITTIDNSRQAVYGYDQRVEAFGSEGIAKSENMHEHQAELGNAQGVSRPPLQHFFLERYTASYLDQWTAFVAAIEHGEDPPVNGADGRAPLVIGLAAKKSMHEGRPVRIEEIRP